MKRLAPTLACLAAFAGGINASDRGLPPRDVKAVQNLIRVGASLHGHELNPAELAAWSITAHAILNLDETVTRR